MALFTDLVILVAPFASNVPDFTAGNAIRESARQFFREAWGMQQEVPINVVAGTNVYAVPTADANTEVVALLGIKRSEYDQLNQLQQDAPVKITGKPTGYLGEFDRKVKLIPAPDTDETLTATVAVRPTFNAASIDDDAFSYHAEAIRYGALAILKSQAGTDWHAPQEIDYYTGLFNQAIADRRAEILLNNQPNNLQIHIPEFV